MKAKVKDGRLIYPFQNDEKFAYCVTNILQRKEAFQNASIYLDNNKNKFKDLEDLRK